MGHRNVSWRIWSSTTRLELGFEDERISLGQFEEPASSESRHSGLKETEPRKNPIPTQYRR